MSEEVIMTGKMSFREASTKLVKECSDPELRMLKIKIDREMNERMGIYEDKYLKGKNKLIK